MDLLAANRHSLGWLTTRGRHSGLGREVELWWSTDGGRIYLISGGGDRSDWVRNLVADPRGSFRTADGTVSVQASLPLTDPGERAAAAQALAAKYRRDPERWQRSAYLIALDPVEA